MRVPVLAMLPAQEPLRESAAASFEGRSSHIPLNQAATPNGLEIDMEFPAIPVGGGNPASMSLESVTADRSEQFVVRGFVEATDPSDIPTERGGAPVFSDPAVAPFLVCGGSSPMGDARTVAQLLNQPGLAARGLDGSGVAIAVMDTGINLTFLRSKLGHMPSFNAANSWSAPGSIITPGTHPVDHGTMCAYDALVMAPKATLLDYPILSSTVPGGSRTGGTLSVALRAYAHLLALWGVAFSPGGAFRGLVVTNSWGVYHPSWDFPAGHPGRYIDNPNHPFTALVSLLARSGADIVFAAGNCGRQCAYGRCQGRTAGAIMGANASPDVLCLAGCDTSDKRVGYSSQGPSIAGMFQQKPDVTAYTHFLGSEAFGTNSADSGTSAACPVAAGCVAAIRTRLSPGTMPPANLFSQIRTSARPAGGPPGWNADYGYGIIDPMAAAGMSGV